MNTLLRYLVLFWLLAAICFGLAVMLNLSRHPIGPAFGLATLLAAFIGSILLLALPVVWWFKGGIKPESANPYLESPKQPQQADPSSR